MVHSTELIKESEMARIAKKLVATDGVRFDFANGTDLECRLESLNDDTIRKLALHGLSQKVGDSYAGAESVGEGVGMAGAVWKNLQAGLWGAKVQRGGKIVEAFSRATGQSIEACAERYAAMDEKQVKTLRKHPDIKRALAEMEAERATALAKVAGDSGEDLGALFD